jgi:GNAT superfamily N-acetyltransferase
MVCRDYNPEKDKDSVYRVLREVGWAEPGKEEVLDLVLECDRSLVADIDGVAECVVCTSPGTMRYLEEELPLVEVTLVATSRVARRQGLAQRVLARALAADVAEGAVVARVCPFDLGFYDQLGFGPGPYGHAFFFDPSTLRVDVRPRVPRRLTADDAGLVHASRLARRRGHGAVNYPAVALSEAEMRYWPDKGFGLGYCDGPNGELTHHFWCTAENVERGPYHIQWMAFQTREQFLELMALLAGLGDQVRLVRMHEPQDMQLQDLLARPFRQRSITGESTYENRCNAFSFWQARVLDLQQCLALTRLWLGVGLATGLAFTDDLDGPPELLDALDSAVRLPEMRPDWDF